MAGRSNAALAAVAVGLALVFALVKPAWIENAPSVRSDGPKKDGGGLAIGFGSGGPAVDAQQPGRGRIAEIVHAPATIHSGGEVAICAPFEGRVCELCVDEGEAVVESAVIFRLDPVEYADKKHEAELELARKKAALAESDAELKEAEHRWTEAVKEPSILIDTRLKVGQSQLARKRASAELENAEAKLARALKMMQEDVGKQEELDAALAERKVQRIALEIAEGELDLATKGVVSQERQWEADKATAEKAIDTARTHVNRARADLVAGEVALVRAARDRERCDVRTPIAGLVTQRSVNDGELVGRGSATAPQYIVSDMSHMLAYADVDEGDVVKVKEGQAAHVRVNALGDELRLAGKVLNVANRAYQKTGEDTKSFRVRVVISPKDERLRPDMTASVEIETRTSSDAALRIPYMAVLHRSKKDLGGAPVAPTAEAVPTTDKPKKEVTVECVMVLEGDHVALRPVSLGVSDGEFVEVLNGVGDDDWVVLGPYRVLEGLKAGNKVRAQKKDRPKPDDVAPATSGPR